MYDVDFDGIGDDRESCQVDFDVKFSVKFFMWFYSHGKQQTKSTNKKKIHNTPGGSLPHGFPQIFHHARPCMNPPVLHTNFTKTSLQTSLKLHQNFTPNFTETSPKFHRNFTPNFIQNSPNFHPTFHPNFTCTGQNFTPHFKLHPITCFQRFGIYANC